jgi:hypothetical protein
VARGSALTLYTEEAVAEASRNRPPGFSLERNIREQEHVMCTVCIRGAQSGISLNRRIL